MISNSVGCREWWCGCIPEIDFQSEKDFIKHMKSKGHNWTEEDFFRLGNI